MAREQSSPIAQLLQEGASAAQIFTALDPLSAAEQAAAVTALTPEQRHLLPGKHPGTHFSDAHKALLQIMFDTTPDEEGGTLCKLLGVRFHLALSGMAGRQGTPRAGWEAHGLRRTWKVLAALPPADVEDNVRLDKLVRYQVRPGGQAEGAYGQVTAIIGYDPNTVEQPDHTFAQPADPLYGANAFDETVRHEVGHAVDSRLEATKQHEGDADWGGWRAYGQDVLAVARAMVEAAQGPIHKWHHAGQRERLIRWLAKRLDVGDAQHIEQALAELEFLDEEGRESIKHDPAVKAAKGSPLEIQQWMRPEIEGGIPVGGRVFQESYRDDWYSYDHEARKRKVSLYQFRAPGEWFAEVYACYYQPVPPPGEKGARLKERDPQIWAWIKEHVDQRAAAEPPPAGSR